MSRRYLWVVRLFGAMGEGGVLFAATFQRPLTYCTLPILLTHFFYNRSVAMSRKNPFPASWREDLRGNLLASMIY